jgi:hypothetical protein
MHNEELKISKDIEIKFHRLLPPTLNSLCLPLSGLYNPIDNEESSEYSLKYKYKNYELSPNNFVNISNLMTINNNFGKIFKSEQLEGLISFSNISSNEITIKNILISLIKMEDYRIQQPFEANIPDDLITIPSNTSYTISLRAPIIFLGKYKLEIFYNKLSPAYDDYYYKASQRNLVKENANNYIIKDGHVEFCDSKSFSFESFKPFKISEFFHNLEVNKSLIEIRIMNIYSFPLTILDAFLTPKNNNINEKIPLVLNLEQMAKNNNKLNDSKFFVLQPDEQIRILFNVNNTDLFYDTKKFTLSITWLNNFDFNKKIYIYDFKNNINSYNEYYRLIIAEKPNNDIILNQNFRIIINLIVKKYSKKFSITMNKDPPGNNKSINKEIEIIDITEKMIELDEKIPSYNFILICKSDILGKVYFPNFKFCLYEGDKNIPIEFVYENLLAFNCISK